MRSSSSKMLWRTTKTVQEAINCCVDSTIAGHFNQNWTAISDESVQPALNSDTKTPITFQVWPWHLQCFPFCSDGLLKVQRFSEVLILAWMNINSSPSVSFSPLAGQSEPRSPTRRAALQISSADLLPLLLLLLLPPPPSSSTPSNAVEQRATRTLTVGSGLSDILLSGLKILPTLGRPFLVKHWPHVAEDGNCTLKKFSQQDRQLGVFFPPQFIHRSDFFFF